MANTLAGSAADLMEANLALRFCGGEEADTERDERNLKLSGPVRAHLLQTSGNAISAKGSILKDLRMGVQEKDSGQGCRDSYRVGASGTACGTARIKKFRSANVD